MRWFSAVLCSLLLLFGVPAKAEWRTVVTRLTIEDGLGSNFINDVGIDNQGYCWLATHGGLYLYDGIKLREVPPLTKVYQPRIKQVIFKNGLLHEIVTSGQRMIIGWGGVHTYRIDQSKKQLRNFAGKFVIWQDELTKILKAHHDTTLRAFFFSDDTFFGYKGDRLGGDTVAFVTTDGVAVATAGKIVYRHRFEQFNIGNIIIADKKIFYLDNGKLWWMDRSFKEKRIALPWRMQRARLLPTTNSSFLAVVRDSIYHIAEGADEKVEISYLFSNSEIAENAALAAWQGKSTLIFATPTKGAFVVRKVAVTQYNTAITKNQNQLISLPNGQGCFSTESRLNILPNQETRLQPEVTTRMLTYCFRESNGKFWLVEITRGCAFTYRTDSLGGKLKLIWQGEPRITRILEHPDGSLLMLGSKKIFSYANGRMDTLAALPTEGFLGIRDCAYGAGGLLYITTSDGVYYLKPNAREAVKLPGTGGLGCRKIVLLPSGKMIFSTYGNGLFFIENMKVHPVPQGRAHALNFTHEIILAGENIVFVSNGGVMLTRIKLLEQTLSERKLSSPYYYMEEDAPSDFEYNGGMYPLSARDGDQLLIPSSRGVRSIDLSTEHTNVEQNPFLSLTVTGDVARTKGNIYHLPPNAVDLNVQIWTTYWSSQSNQHIYYCMLTRDNPTADTIWQRADRLIKLPSLRPGTYDIGVRKYIGLDERDLVTQWVVVDKADYFYRTTGFMWILVLASLGSSGLGFWVWKKREQMKQTKLKLLISETNAELLRRNQVFMRLFRVLHHDVSGSLSGLAQTLRVVSTDKTVNELSYYTDGVSTYLKDILTWIAASLGTERLQVTNEKITFPDFTTALLESPSFREINSRLRVTHTFSAPLTLYADKRVLEIIIRNILTNTMRYGGPELRISQQAEQGKLSIVFQDNGRGFSEHVFTSLKQGEVTPTTGGHGLRGGMGLEIIEELAKVMGAQASFDNAPEGGAIVRITFPEEVMGAKT